MIVSVVYGGTKEECGPSQKNAKDIAAALEKKGHTVHLLEICEDIIAKLKAMQTEAVYLCVQGKGYGDGTFQAILEQEKIPFTGSRMRAACLINDKILCKLLFDHYGVSTPQWDILSRQQYEEGSYPYEQFGYPFVAKAPTQGGSFGIELIESEADLGKIESVFTYDNPIMIERFIDGSFFTIGFYESNKEVVALPVVEGLDLRKKQPEEKAKKNELISFTGEFGIRESALDPAIAEKIQALGRKVFDITGAQGYARVDLMVGRADQTPYVLEINAVPGLKRVSLMPREAELAGIVYEDMIEDILKAAF